MSCGVQNVIVDHVEKGSIVIEDLQAHERKSLCAGLVCRVCADAASCDRRTVMFRAGD
jgi:hypothetical protein